MYSTKLTGLHLFNYKLYSSTKVKLQNTNQIIPYGPTSRLYSVCSTLVFIHFALIGGWLEITKTVLFKYFPFVGLDLYAKTKRRLTYFFYLIFTFLWNSTDGSIITWRLIHKNWFVATQTQSFIIPLGPTCPTTNSITNCSRSKNDHLSEILKEN